MVRPGLVAAVVLIAVGAVPAQAAHQEALRGNWLHLTVTWEDSRAGHKRGTLLRCDPPRGHAHAAEACTELAAAGGDISAIPQKDVLCTMIYAPVTVQARGRWDGQSLRYTETFSNGCVMAARTGSVFALDE